MITLLMGCLFLALFLVVGIRNFFVQLMAVKLLIDVLVFAIATIRGQEQSTFIPQASAIIIAGFGSVLFFGLFAAGIIMFSRSKSLDLEAADE